MLKTFYLKHIKVQEVEERLRSLGLASYSAYVDVDTRLNALTVNTPHKNILEDIENFINSVDVDKPPVQDDNP